MSKCIKMYQDQFDIQNSAENVFGMRIQDIFLNLKKVL